ncbi:hypothetical protein [Domibacillus iocasae]|uniref:Uncharacterized protein n=1 Tax=Domibacillus iocasae TaxID=1714016 RepID=A0A1E7DRW7_9BACI|nr:hypothetical protein [Domibacillus iocasae]OES45832.1 hypothetical protein BA724_03240 [Domibacillus iocasae]
MLEYGYELLVDVYETDDLKRVLACYPVHWFEHFDLIELETKIENIETVSDQVIEEDIFDKQEEPAFFEQMKPF